MSGPAEIVVDKLSKSYGPLLAVDRVSFEVPKGQIVGFLGPNGAGKSTTIRMLTCFLPPTSGRATVAGHVVFQDSLAVREKIGYFMPAGEPRRSIRKCVIEYLDCCQCGCARMDRAARQKRIAEVAERCWLKETVADAGSVRFPRGIGSAWGLRMHCCITRQY